MRGVEPLFELLESSSLPLTDTPLLYNYSMVKENLVFLPGWTKKKEDYHELCELLSKKYKVYALDLPGFGGPKLKKPYSLLDYAEYVINFLEKTKLKKVLLAGHSNGGRIALKIALTRPDLVSQLILIDSGGIERKNILIKAIKVIKSIKIIKLVTPDFLRNIFGSEDYLKAKENLRKTLVNIVEENLEPELAKIKTKTLIIWGRDDHTTPLWQGKLMHQLIKNSQLRIIDGDHGVPYRKAAEVAKIICS